MLMAGHILGNRDSYMPVDYKGLGHSTLLILGVFITITVRPLFFALLPVMEKGTHNPPQGRVIYIVRNPSPALQGRVI